MNPTEDDLREALRRHAEGFDMPPIPSGDTRDGIGRRRSRNGIVAAVSSATIAVIVAASVVVLHSTGPASSGSSRSDGVAEMSYVLVDSQVSVEPSAPK